MTAPNLIRSAKAPTINTAVIHAKDPWKAEKTYSGMVGNTVDIVSGVMPFMNTLSTLPIMAPSPENANEYPYRNHKTVISENVMKTCISTESMFLVRANPP